MPENVQQIDEAIFSLQKKNKSGGLTRDEANSLACLFAIKGGILNECLEDLTRHVGAYARAMLIKNKKPLERKEVKNKENNEERNTKS